MAPAMGRRPERRISQPRRGGVGEFGFLPRRGCGPMSPLTGLVLQIECCYLPSHGFCRGLNDVKRCRPLRGLALSTYSTPVSSGKCGTCSALGDKGGEPVRPSAANGPERSEGVRVNSASRVRGHGLSAASLLRWSRTGPSGRPSVVVRAMHPICGQRHWCRLLCGAQRSAPTASGAPTSVRLSSAVA